MGAAEVLEPELMDMVPRSLQRQLNRLRRRERLLQLTWTGARCLAVFTAALAAACLLDWLVDLYRDTPRWLRVGLLAGQWLLWLLGLVAVVRVLSRRRSDAEVALWVEEEIPDLGHRLITAVQLNQPGAATRGMSPELIAAVTRQAEEQAAHTNFAQVADTRRLLWTAELLAPVAVVVVLLFGLCPETVQALLARQFLADRLIPRSLAIESASGRQVWPAGEDGVLRFRVRGPVADEAKGEVRLDPQEGRSERHELIFESREEDGAATFLARVPPASQDFSYVAWLGDGRTHQPAEVHFEPRPIVQKQEAWVQLPGYIGLKPSGQPFEELQKGADLVYRLKGSTARVAIETQKPIVRATVEVMGPPHSLAEVSKPGVRVEAVRRSVNLEVQEGGRRAEGAFSFQPGTRPEFLGVLAASGGVGCPSSLPWASLLLATRADSLQTETAYRIVVCDEFGLENNDKPRRSIRTAPVDPPEVALQPETFWKQGDSGPPEDREVEGIPILLGQRIPLGYDCRANYGLSHARLRYRVIPHSLSREDDPGEPPERDFLPLPLGTPYNQMSQASKKALEEFSALPAADPERIPGTEGTGHFDFDSAGIPDSEGGLLKLQEGDRLQFYVEVFGRADPEGQPGRSAVREKEVVGQQEFLAWLDKKEDQKERIRQLEEKQRGASGTTSLLPGDPLPAGPERRTQPPPRPPAATEATEGEAIFGRSWLLLGPFPNDNDTGHDRVFPPETEPVDLRKQYDGFQGKVGWQVYHSLTDKIDLEKYYSHGEAGVAYAVCWIRAPGRVKVTLSTGSDDGIKVWAGRKLVLDKAVHREAVPGDDKTPFFLEAGWQEVLVKIDNRFGTWAFYLDLLSADSGKPWPAAHRTVRITPPELDPKRFVKSWQIVGPFRAELKGPESPFPPEKGPVDLKAEYHGRYGKVRWKSYVSTADLMDLRQALPVRGGDAQDTGFAACWVRSDKKQTALLATGSYGPLKVWVNHRNVLDKDLKRAAEPASDRVPVELADGWNEVLVRTIFGYGGLGFYFEVRDPATGAPLPGVEFRGAPPEKK
jgi:hypothetical protein